MNSEAGEAADEIKKMMRDDNGKLTEDRCKKIKTEMGDSLFYMALLVTELGFSFDEAAFAEIKKLNGFIKDWERRTGKSFNSKDFKKDKRKEKIGK
jgi:NTP pyrophosphatase (non-canonical NTP hydrolase)